MLPSNQPFNPLIPPPPGAPAAARPTWVALALWGLPNRGAAWFVTWLAVGVALAFLCYGILNPICFIWGLFALIAAIWYYRAMRWVDLHGRWS